jgi:hypothetical protein
LWDWLRHFFTKASKEVAMENNKIWGYEIGGLIAGALIAVVVMALL